MDKNQLLYNQVMNKFGDVKSLIEENCKTNNIPEIIRIWDLIREEARFFVFDHEYQNKYTYFQYCGQDLQTEFFGIVSKYYTYDFLKSNILNNLDKNKQPKYIKLF